METKIARVMNEVVAPMKIYQMSPAFYGAALIAVTTGKEYIKMLKQDGEVDVEFTEMAKNNEHKILILPGIDLGEGIAITKSMGHFIEGTLEETLAEEGYVIMDIG